MPMVRSTADMITFLEWRGYVPDDIPEEDRWRWIKDNVDGGEFVEPNPMDGDWVWGTDVEVIEDV